MTELLHQTKELVVQAGNGAMAQKTCSKWERYSKRSRKKWSLWQTARMPVANTCSPAPNRIRLYSMTGTWPDITITYSGNDGQKSLAISDTRQIAISEPGHIFGTGTGSAGSFFEVMAGFANVLRKGRPERLILNPHQQVLLPVLH